MTANVDEGPLMGWQPIETAPKDGTRVLLYRPLHAHPALAHPFAIGHRTNTGWRVNGLPTAGTATHWMPLPEPPK